MAKKQRQASLPERPQALTSNLTPEPRSLEIPGYLLRLLPYYGHPQWLQAAQWRAFVRNQPIAQICRDTLLDNLKNLEWDVVPADPEAGSDAEVKKAVQYYGDFVEHLEGDFDKYLDLVGQDMFDLPFGGASEVGRLDDEAEGPVVWAKHIDAGTLYPSDDAMMPVFQSLPESMGRVVAFPYWSIDRLVYSPRPEIRRRGWGMAPPEKVYLAIEMLFRGDNYYWKLLLDTPEAGVLDLIDMSRESAEQWLDQFRTLFQGIDGMKVPVLHSHTKAAQWIPLNRPPIDLIYDKAMMNYGQIVAAGYGMRLSDLGIMDEGGGGTLAGVIRAERQTRRSGFASAREKFRNHINRMIQNIHPPVVKFTWIERDDEAMVARGRAMLAVGQALATLKDGGFISPEEGRMELVAQGLMETDIDPKKLPEPPAAAVNPLAALFGQGAKVGKDGKIEGGAKPSEGQDEAAKSKDGGETPASAGGRGSQAKPAGAVARFLTGLTRRADTTQEKPGVAYGKNPATRDVKELLREMDSIIKPGLALVPDRATERDGIRLRRLIRAATKVLVPRATLAFRSLDDDALPYWVEEMSKLDFDLPSELDGFVTRQDSEEARAAIGELLDGEDWWEAASALDKATLLELYSAAYSAGALELADEIASMLYERGISATLGPALSFALTNPVTLRNLERRAGDLVTFIDDGTKTFIKRIVTAGVRQGLSSPDIARALRDGANAEEVLSDAGFLEDVIAVIMRGLTDMSEARTNSIVNYEVAWAENAGKWEWMTESGFTEKAWVHLGERGVTEKGNPHPCPLCERNEALGFVPIDYLYETVFEGSPFPPGHPGVCHCDTVFNPEELVALVKQGTFTPWAGS
jgi:hypothetical protein